MDLRALFSGTLDLSDWEHVKTRENYDKYENTLIPGLVQNVYEKTIEGVVYSLGVFSYKEKLAYIAWGLKADEHCSFHARLCSRSMVQQVVVGCPEVVPFRSKKGEAVGFTLGGRAFGEAVEVKQNLLETVLQKFKTFLPLISAFALVLIFATVKNYPVLGVHTFHEWMLDFMAGFFLVFGGLKIAGLKQFASTYKTYDLIAKRWGGWGFVYPFAEFALGILFLARQFIPIANVATVVLMLVGSVGIYTKLQSKQNTACACLGGFFSVPLTWLTFAENILMAGMALWMLW